MANQQKIKSQTQKIYIKASKVGSSKFFKVKKFAEENLIYFI